MTKFEIYDTIISRGVINLISLARRNNNTIILKDFNPHDTTHLLMFEMATIVTNSYSENFVLKIEMPWYRRIITPRRIRKVSRALSKENGINIQEFMDFTREGFEVVSCEEIWKEYYAR